jgi:HEAT repeat protein
MTSDESPYVRKQAASTVKAPDLFRTELLKALQDADVRVREAATQALATRAGAFARDALFQRLKGDDWPLVRLAAADALSAQAPDNEIDLQLAQAIGDSASLVRSHAIDALGHRQAFAQAPKILERFESRDEPMKVRMSAARALGWLCHQNAVSALRDRAVTLRDPALDAEQRSLAGVSLAALSRIHPNNLQSLLAPLLKDKDVNPSVRRAAQAAVNATERCGQLH